MISFRFLLVLSLKFHSWFPLIKEARAFCPSPGWPVKCRHRGRRVSSCLVQKQLHNPLQLFVATPYEEISEEEELRDMEMFKNDALEDMDNDWTPVAGGFLPRLFRSSSHAPTKLRKELITEVSTLEDYKREVIDCEEQIVVVKFYSASCRSCKEMAPLFKKLANALSDNEKVKFVQVPVTRNNAVLHQGLGIPSVPYGHVYHKEGGLVEERKLNKKVFNDFQDVLYHYVDGCCQT